MRPGYGRRTLADREVVVGVLSTVETSETGFLLRIDAWHVGRFSSVCDVSPYANSVFLAQLSGEYETTAFINGITYP